MSMERIFAVVREVYICLWKEANSPKALSDTPRKMRGNDCPCL